MPKSALLVLALWLLTDMFTDATRMEGHAFRVRMKVMPQGNYSAHESNTAEVVTPPEKPAVLVTESLNMQSLIDLSGTVEAAGLVTLAANGLPNSSGISPVACTAEPSYPFQAAQAAAVLGGTMFCLLVGLRAWVQHGESPAETAAALQSKAQVTTELPRGQLNSTWTLRMLNAMNVLIHINFTIVLPTSHEVAWKAGASTAQSGIMIGVYGIGAIMMLPVFFYFSKTSYRHGMMLAIMFLVCGNMVFMFGAFHGTWWRLVLGRLLCGMEYGVGPVLTANAVLAVVHDDATKRAEISMNKFSSASGLLLGPMLYAVTVDIFGEGHQELPAVMITALGVMLGILIMLFFPHQSELLQDREAERSKDDEPDGHEFVTVHDSQKRLACFGIALDAGTNCIRFVQRVGFEAAMVYILAMEYQHGSKIAGYAASVPLAGYIVFSVWMMMSKGWSSHLVLWILEACEFVGLALLYRPLESVTNQLWCIIFLCGGSLFYGANSSLQSVLVPMRARVAVPEHRWLSVEAGTMWAAVAGLCGLCLGPIIIRNLMGMQCTQQRTVFWFFMVLFVFQAVSMHLAMHILEKTEKPKASGAKP